MDNKRTINYLNKLLTKALKERGKLKNKTNQINQEIKTIEKLIQLIENTKE